MSRLVTLAKADIRLTLRDGEQLLLAFILPVVFLALFSSIDLLPTGGEEPVDFLTPGILALALISTAFVRLAISVGFDRSFGAIARFASTPLRPLEFIGAKLVTTVAVFAVQTLVLVALAAALGWRPDLHPALLPGLVLGTVAFTALAFALVGFVDGLASLAAANTLYVLLLLLSGLVFDRSELPGFLDAVTAGLPSTQLVEIVRAATTGGAGPGWAWLGLCVWAVVGTVLGLRRFHWR